MEDRLTDAQLQRTIGGMELGDLNPTFRRRVVAALRELHHRRANAAETATPTVEAGEPRLPEAVHSGHRHCGAPEGSKANIDISKITCVKCLQVGWQLVHREQHQLIKMFAPDMTPSELCAALRGTEPAEAGETALRAEVRRLREALRGVLDMFQVPISVMGGEAYNIDSATLRTARAALADAAPAGDGWRETAKELPEPDATSGLSPIVWRGGGPRNSWPRPDQVTHWRPLPSPPSPNARAAEGLEVRECRCGCGARGRCVFAALDAVDAELRAREGGAGG